MKRINLNNKGKKTHTNQKEKKKKKKNTQTPRFPDSCARLKQVISTAHEQAGSLKIAPHPLNLH